MLIMKIQVKKLLVLKAKKRKATLLNIYYGKLTAWLLFHELPFTIDNTKDEES